MPSSVGFYWDLENCQIPANKSAFAFVQKLRSYFGENATEEEFVCVCDVTKERPGLMRQLNSAQANVVHVASTSKNAADEKLKSHLRKFQLSFTNKPAIVVLISGDVGFASELYMMRYKSLMEVVLVHTSAVSRALLSIATRSVPLKQLLQEIPDINPVRPRPRFPTKYWYPSSNAESWRDWETKQDNQPTIAAAGGKEETPPAKSETTAEENEKPIRLLPPSFFASSISPCRRLLGASKGRLISSRLAIRFPIREKTVEPCF